MNLPRFNSKHFDRKEIFTTVMNSSQHANFRLVLKVLLISVYSLDLMVTPCDITQIKPGNCSHPRWDWVGPFNRCLTMAFLQSSWDKVQEQCVSYGGTLVKIVNSVQNQRIQRRYKCGGPVVWNSCKARYAWIGLRRDTQSSNYTWVSDGTKWTQGVDFGNTVQQIRGDCIYWHRMTFDWRTDSCSGPNHESKPEKPKILSKYVTFFLGEQLTATCRSLLGIHGEMRFYILGNTTEFIRARNTTLVRYTEVHDLDWNGKCNRYAEGSLSIPVTWDLLGKTLACVSATTKNTPICSANDTFCARITTFPSEPDFCISCWVKGHVLLSVMIAVAPVITLLLLKLVCRTETHASSLGGEDLQMALARASRGKPETVSGVEGHHSDDQGSHKHSEGSGVTGVQLDDQDDQDSEDGQSLAES
ncbi:hypothetical protein RRG08_036955 [Elysia crispata]|uniref:C-type lectin domain-containing protein n=1 Tax=Elysia crispata TaxID=231223 RepID=A0AAE1D732_9GAST|nr:hypothetical protein RRG08_036955 [Elysia crispata]